MGWNLHCPSAGKKNSIDDWLFILIKGYHQRENTGSRLFTKVKPCWTGLISGSVTIWIAFLCCTPWTSIKPSTSTTNVVCGMSFGQSQPDFEGFLRVLRFPPSSILTPSLNPIFRTLLITVLCTEGLSWINIGIIIIIDTYWNGGFTWSIA